MPLSYATPGEESVIRKVSGSPDIKKHLENLGFVVGGSVTVITATNGNVIVKDAGSLRNEDEIASRIFSILRELDSDGVQYIYSENFDTPRLGAAITDRMNRAAGFCVINATEED